MYMCVGKSLEYKEEKQMYPYFCGILFLLLQNEKGVYFLKRNDVRFIFYFYFLLSG